VSLAPVLGGVLSMLALCLLLALLIAVGKRKGFAVRGPRAARADSDPPEFAKARRGPGAWVQTQGLRANMRLGHMGAGASSLYDTCGDDHEDAPWHKEYVPEIELSQEPRGGSRAISTADVRIVPPAASIRRSSTEGPSMEQPSPVVAVALQETATDQNRTIARIRRVKTNPMSGTVLVPAAVLAPPPPGLPPGYTTQAALSLDDLLGEAGSSTRLPPPGPPTDASGSEGAPSPHLRI